MSLAEPAEGFHRAKLSEREREVLDLAIEGLTDLQIAQRIGIRPSTVNSYWVRIRGKLGQFSRTELVASALRESARHEISELMRRSEELRLLALENNTQGHENAEIYEAAFEVLPEPLMILDEGGTILFSNDALDHLLGYERGMLVGQSLATVIPPDRREVATARLMELSLASPPLKAGVDKVIFARRRNGTSLRVMLLLASRSTSRGPIVVCIVRPFVEEVDLLRRQASAFASTL
jgi:PAS domain S-box-containing protein